MNLARNAQARKDSRDGQRISSPTAACRREHLSTIPAAWMRWSALSIRPPVPWRVQISFPNPERLLRPGQYGRVRFASEIRRDALLVLQRAVQELQDRHNVVVVDADNKVSVRSVKVGPRVGDLWVIDEGLKPGERVVVEGLQRLRDGMTVKAVPVAASASSPAAPGATSAVEEQ